MSRLWSFLRALFSRPNLGRGVARAEPAPGPAPEPPSAVEPAPEDRGPLSGSAEVAQEWEDAEDDWPEEDEEAADDEPDPFITGASPPAEPAGADLEDLRARARVEALSGEHRIALSSPAGPGSLAEALNLLHREGLVQAEYVEEGVEGPHLRYQLSAKT